VTNYSKRGHLREAEGEMKEEEPPSFASSKSSKAWIERGLELTSCTEKNSG
jgi:hypothetical protein